MAHVSEAMSTIFQISLIVVLFPYPKVTCRLARSLIWNKYQGTFVDVFSLPQFADLEEHAKSKAPQYPVLRDLQGTALRVSFHEEKHLVMFYDNDTKITGICGEVWNLLRDYLNFTMVPVKYRRRKFGVRLKNGSYNGLVGLLVRNETDVILRAGLYPIHNNVMNYAMPIWKTPYRLYTRPDYRFDNMWIITIFSPMEWLFIATIFVLLCFAGFKLQKFGLVTCENMYEQQRLSLYSHILYTFAILCNQGHYPNIFLGKLKLLTIIKATFAWLVLATFSSQLIYFLTNRTATVPFSSLDDLLYNTKYTILAFAGSMVQESFEGEIKMLSKSSRNKMDARVKYLISPEEMYEVACKSNKKYAVFEIEDRLKAWHGFLCKLVPSGIPYFEAMIGSGVRRDFEHTESLNMGIMRLYETGLLKALKRRWLYMRVNDTSNDFKMIDLDQVYLIFMIFTYGFGLSIIIFIIELAIHTLCYKNTKEIK